MLPAIFDLSIILPDDRLNKHHLINHYVFLLEKESRLENSYVNCLSCDSNLYPVQCGNDYFEPPFPEPLNKIDIDNMRKGILEEKIFFEKEIDKYTENDKYSKCVINLAYIKFGQSLTDSNKRIELFSEQWKLYELSNKNFSFEKFCKERFDKIKFLL